MKRALALAVLLTAMYAAESAQELFRKGVALIENQQLQAAAACFRQALALEPGFLGARKNLGTVLWFLEQRAESEAEFRKVVRAAPRDPVPHLYLGLAAHDRREFERAAAELENAGDLAAKNPEVLPAFLESLLGAAESFDRRGRPEDAYSAYQKAIALDPKFETGYVTLARFASAHGNDPFALTIVNRGLGAVPGSAALTLEQGIVLSLQGRIEDASRSFRAALKMDPKNLTARLGLGLCELQRGRAGEAPAIFQAAAGEAPRDFQADYLYALALSRTEDEARREDAISALERAIGLAPRDPRPRSLLGKLLLSAGRIPQAVAELEIAAKLAPDDAPAMYQLSLAYRRAGRAEDARLALEKFEAAKARTGAHEEAPIQILRVH